MRAPLGIMQRKLTAILSADVVGYSALMEPDEAGTLERLKVESQHDFRSPRRRAWRPRVQADGRRGVGGVRQRRRRRELRAGDTGATEKAGAEIAGAKRIRYRIGINLGEVIVEGDDIYGEGVNVAARLQALAPVGRRAALARRPRSGRRQGRPARSRIWASTR